MASAAQEVVVKLITLSCVGTSDEKEDAAKALADLAFNEDNQVAKAGGITPLISLARSGTDGQKYWAARALEHLAINADNKVAIVKAGGIAPLVALVRDGTEGQKWAGARALWSLAGNDDNRVAIVNEGGRHRAAGGAGSRAPLVALARGGTDGQKSMPRPRRR